METLIAWILRAIPFGTIIMYGAMGEIITEKSGNLNRYDLFPDFSSFYLHFFVSFYSAFKNA